VYAVANKDPENDQPLTLDFQGLGLKTPRKVQARILSGSSPDDFNDIGHEDRVKPYDKALPVKGGAVTIPAHSVTFLSLGD
jgi:alpha-L-arabinofuranosidase